MEVESNLGRQSLGILSQSDLVVDVDLTEAFQEIEIALSQFDAEGHAPLKVGEKPFHWNTIERACKDLLASHNDLRVIVWWLRASMHARGFVGLLEAVVCLNDVLDLPQEKVSPRTTNEEVGEVYQIALAWLASDAFLFQLKATPLSEDFELTLGGVISGGDLLQIKLAGMLNKVLDELKVLENSFQKIYSFLGEKTDGEYLFDFHKVLMFCQNLVKSLSTYVVDTTQSDDVVENKFDRTDFQPTTQYGTPVSHEEVRVQIDQLLRYFRKYEPSHPAPILLQRVRRMVGASFEDMMQELYADAKQLVAKIDTPDSVVH